MSEDNKSVVPFSNNDKIFEQEIIHKGKEILQENNFFKELDSLMNNTEFRNFYDKYFRDFHDIKTMLMFMKLYETLEKEYYNKYGEKINKDVIIYLIREIMVDDGLRKDVVNSFADFSNKDNLTKKIELLNIFKNIQFIE